ncbi:MAG: alkaline phosphatase family protein [Saprospirales bacterium]|nr:MAG: alkaline phosphatase family protein [Saprospirales bacterium]
MKYLQTLAAFALLPLLLVNCQSPQSEEQSTERNTTVILSLDGFRWDYAEHTPTPNLDKIAENGVMAEALIPVFPTGTFANHYTMATGLYPENHGIVNNRFTCPILGKDYNKGDRSTVRDGKFYEGEPIWVTAQKQGLSTACFFWVGSEADVEGIRPDRWKKYQNDFPYGDRIDTVVHWLSLPEGERPDLIMWYYHQIDSDGHRYGPLADSLLMTVRMKDSLIGVFLEKVDQLPNRDQINFIIVSDHGMAEVLPDGVIHMDQQLDTALVDFFDGGSTKMNIKAKDGEIDQIYESLSQVENIRVWKAGEVPGRLNYGNHPRSHDIIVLADVGYTLGWSWRNYTFRGNHGYDNEHPDMHGIFYAMGPDFRKGETIPAFKNKNIYPLLTHLLGIKAADSDADFSAVQEAVIISEN